MKKAALVFLITFLASGVFAQIAEKGQWRIGINLVGGETIGTTGMSYAPSLPLGISLGLKQSFEGSTETFTASTAGINVLAEAGYYIVDGLELGPMLSYRFWDWHENGGGGGYDREEVIAPGAQASYTIRLGGRIHPFAQVGATFLWLHREYPQGRPEDEFGFRVSPEAGVRYELGGASIDIGLFGSYWSLTAADTDPVERTQLLNGGLRFGLSLYL
jgi:hypothetical protein